MYPKKGKKVFIEATNESDNAIISFCLFASKYYEYENSYLNAADILVDAFLQKKGDFNSNLVYPIFFLYRQYLELLMKDILKNYYRVNFPPMEEREECKFQELLGKHNLMNLWKRVEELALSQENEFPIENDGMDLLTILQNTKNYIGEIEKVDQSSFAFRYPTDKDEKLYHQKKDEKVDLKNIKECIHEISNVLLMIQGTLCLVREMEDYFMKTVYK